MASKARKANARGQGTFGFTRAGQLHLKRHAVIPAVKIVEGQAGGGRTITVTPAQIFAVLTVIDDHGPRCWPSIDTIAGEARISRRSAVRAIKALQTLDLICVEKRPKPTGGLLNQYSINWGALQRLCPESRVPPQQIASAIRANRECHCGTQSHQEAPNEVLPLPPPKHKRGSGQDSWTAVAVEFRKDLGSIDQLIDQAIAKGIQPADFATTAREAITTARLPCNAGKLDRPMGAVAWFLRNGTWPQDGIQTIADAQFENSIRQATDAARAQEQAEAEEIAAELQRLKPMYYAEFQKLSKADVRELAPDQPSWAKRPSSFPLEIMRRMEARDHVTS